MQTRLTELLGIERPIVSAPLSRMSGGTLAAAVSEAGGLGTFGGVARSLRISARYVQREIDVVRAHTHRPFGIGFLTHNLPYAPENFDLALDAGVPVLLFSFDDPTPWVTRARDAGRHTICQVQTINDARIAVDAGADILAVQGNEAGGHTGRQNLLPFLVEVLEQFPDTPVIAAGGITNGRSLAAVLAAGADGAWMGSAFVATVESTEIPEPIKNAVLNTGYGDTVYTKVFDIANQATIDDVPWPDHIAIRAKRNAFTNRWHGSEPDLIEHLPQIGPAYAEAARTSDTDEGPVLIGEGASSIRSIRPVADVITEICDHAIQLLTQRARQIS